MLKKILAAVFCIMILFCISVSAADFKEGDIAYVKKYSLPVTEKPTAGGELTPGDGAQRTAYASTAFLTYDGIPIKAACCNINGNNYFKLRDVTDALDCRVEWDSGNKLIKVYTSLPAYADPN